MRRYLERIPLRPPRHRIVAARLAADPAGDRALDAPEEERRALRLDLEQERNELPLKTFTRAQAEKLAAELASERERHASTGRCATASRRSPSGSSALAKAGCDRILLFPLYPQYSATTTATVNDKAFDALKTMRWQPALRTVPPYHDEPVYIDALAESIEKHLAALDFEPEVMLASYHGLPNPISRRATPITAIARRRRGCCARGSAGARSGSSRRSSRASARRNGCSPTPTRRWSGWPAKA